MIWCQGQRKGREADEKRGQRRNVEEGGTVGAGHGRKFSEGGKVEGRTRTCLPSHRKFGL